MANRLGNQGRFEDACDCFEEILNIDPSIEEAYVGLGMALGAQGLNREAVIALEEALDINSNNIEVLRYLGRYFAKLGKTEESINSFDKAISFEPDNYLLWYDKGVTCSNGGYTHMAIKCYKEVIKLNPSFYDVWYNLGMTHAQLGKFDESLHYLDKSLEMNPKDQKVKQSRKMVAGERKKFGSKKYYAEETDEGMLINLGDGSKEAIEGGLAALHESLYKKLRETGGISFPTLSSNNEEEEVEEKSDIRKESDLKKEVEVNDLLNTALEFIKLTQFNEAISYYKKVLEIDPYNINAWGWMGQAHYHLKQFEEANECYKNAIINFEKENGDDELLDEMYHVTYHGISFTMLEIWDNKGDSLLMLNKYHEGIKCYEKVLSIEPERLKTLQNMAAAYEKQGKLIEALKYSIKRLQLDPGNSKLKEAKVLLEHKIQLKNLSKYPVKVNDFVKKAIKLNESEDYEDCIKISEQILQEFPNIVLAWYFKAWSLKLIDKDDEAIECLQKLLEIDRDYIDANNLMGIIYRNCGRFEEALECYDHVLRLDPTIHELWNNKGNVYENLGQFEKADECFNEALKYEPNSVKALVNKSILLEKMNKSEEAQKFFNLAKKSNPLQAWYERALSLKKKQKFREALKCFDEILRIDSNNEKVIHERIYLLTRLKTEKKIETYQELKEKGVNDKNVWTDNGMLLTSVGEFKDAYNCFEEAIKIDPTNVNNLINKATILPSLKRWNEAIEYYDQILKEHPKSSTAWYNKSVTLSLIDRFEEALICADNAIKFDKKKVSAYHNKSAVLEALERYEEALKTIEEAIKIDPTKSLLWFKKGNIFFKLKEFKQAIECFDKVLKGDPNFEFYEQARRNKGAVIMRSMLSF